MGMKEIREENDFDECVERAKQIAGKYMTLSLEYKITKKQRKNRKPTTEEFNLAVALFIKGL